MGNITERIQSLRSTLGASYSRPKKELVGEFVAALHGNEDALAYLRLERNLSDDTIRTFQLGYSREKNAISIPVFKGGELVNIKYRLLDKESKQRYLGESNAEAWVFNEDGFSHAKKKGAVLVVEGEIDAMSVWQSGIKNVVSPSSGKDSVGQWVELLDNVPKIYIGFDNDDGGRSASSKLAARLGSERCFEVVYRGAKDANEYLKKFTPEDFRGLLRDAKPFIRQQFKTVLDVIQTMREGVDDSLKSSFMPEVKLQKGFMAVVSGVSNIGKTSYVLNIADEFAKKGVGVLVFPFERGIESVGSRFLHIHCNTKPEDFGLYTDSDWGKVITETSQMPLYFAMPGKDEVVDFIIKSKRLFDTSVVIVDHLDYLVRQTTNSRGDAIMDTMQNLKRVAEDNGIVLIIVTHIRKIEQPGGFIQKRRRPNIEDLKGSSSLYQDPEVVVLLSEGENDGEILVDVVKNKGEMTNRTYFLNKSTGAYSLTRSADVTKHDTSTSDTEIKLSKDKKGRDYFDNGLDFDI